MDNETSVAVADGTDQRAGQYLTYVLAGEVYGLTKLCDRIEDEAAGPDAVLEAEENGRAFDKAVSHALTALDDRERLIARKRLMDDEPMTLADLGREIGVSRERARQLELRAKRKLAAVLADSGITAHTFHAAVS